MKFVESVKGFAHVGRFFTKKGIFLIFWGPDTHHPAPIEVKFCTANVPIGRAKFHVDRFNESPLRGEKPDFRPVSKLNTGSLRLAQSCR